jgi:hypothetical protein
MDNTLEISDNTKRIIMEEHIEPTYIYDVKNTLALRKYFKRIGLSFELLSKIFVGVSSVISFAAGIYKTSELSFVSGSTSVISLVLLQFASHSYNESKKNTTELNSILRNLHLVTVVDTTPTVSSSGQSTSTGPESFCPLSKEKNVSE